MKSPRFSIVIDPEFQSLVPPMSADSLAQLEQNIREHGLLDRLSLWEREDGTFVLIDGHHRYDVLQRLAQEKQEDSLADDDTRVQLREADGANREAVKLWILQNQVGRRNLTLEERTTMVAKIVVLRQRISAEVSKANLKQGTESPEPRGTQIASVGKTVRAAAKEFGVPQRPLQAAVNAAKGKPAPAKTAKPHNQDNHETQTPTSPFNLRMPFDRDKQEMTFLEKTVERVPVTDIRRSQYTNPTYKGEQLYDVHFIGLTEKQVYEMLEKQDQRLFEEVAATD